jgi:hypothetical protein
LRCGRPSEKLRQGNYRRDVRSRGRRRRIRAGPAERRHARARVAPGLVLVEDKVGAVLDVVAACAVAQVRGEIRAAERADRVALCAVLLQFVRVAGRKREGYSFEGRWNVGTSVAWVSKSDHGDHCRALSACREYRG